MMVEIDINYNGGISVEASTAATLSVPAWDAYMKPITVPIVVAIKIKRFSARVLLKIKPFWESNRLWFGFYHEPELKLELQVDPIISNKLIKLHLVNQVIERRIKSALSEYVMLPNMDDLLFWDFRDIFGSPLTDESSEENSEDELEVESLSIGRSPLYITNFASVDTDQESVNAALMGEVLESSISSSSRTRTDNSRRRIRNVLRILNENDKYKIDTEVSLSEKVESQTDRHGYGGSELSPGDITTIGPLIRTISALSRLSTPSISRTTSKSSQQSLTESVPLRQLSMQDLDGSAPDDPSSGRSSVSDSNSKKYVEQLGNTAYQIGELLRKNGIDKKAQTVAASVASYAQPAVDYASTTTMSYSVIVQEAAAAVGLSAIERLGLAHDKKNVDDPLEPKSESTPALRHKSSISWNMLGFKVETKPPEESSIRKDNSKSIKKQRSRILKVDQSQFGASIAASIEDLSPKGVERNINTTPSISNGCVAGSIHSLMSSATSQIKNDNSSVSSSQILTHTIHGQPPLELAD